MTCFVLNNRALGYQRSVAGMTLLLGLILLTTSNQAGAVICESYSAPACENPTSGPVTEPDGTVIPRCPSKGGQRTLQNFFDTRGEQLDALQDASADRQVFSPLCEFKVTWVYGGAGHGSGPCWDIAWYNVNESSSDPPSHAELAENVILPAHTPHGTCDCDFLGATVTAEQIRSDPNYTGGLIGFAMLEAYEPSYQIRYTERRHNPKCTTEACGNEPWILSLSYPSTEIPNAFYIGWEDLPVEPTSFGGNDGDFNDMIMLVEGVTCAGGAERCDTNQPGLCRTGITECSKDDELVCKPLFSPEEERCDHLDNNCNGVVDDGDLCEGNQVCFEGRCVPNCTSGEFPCEGGLTCDPANGLCVEPACVGISCSGANVCRDGKCAGPCDGIVCPKSQICNGGLCVDPCEVVDCQDGQVCEAGACLQPCHCRPCQAGQECATDGRCVDTGCADASCSGSEICEQGRCVDPCEGAICPDGKECQGGRCLPPVGNGGSSAGGTGPVIALGGNSSASGGATSPDAGKSTNPPLGRRSLTGNEGCGCLTIGAAVSPLRIEAGFAFLWLLLWRRQRRFQTRRSRFR